MNKKENLKYRSTHKAIMDAVLALLKEKDLNHITVAEVCRCVHINRSTFYEHFVDIPDVLDKMATQVNEAVLQIIPSSKPERENFLRLFYHVRENSAFYMLFFRQELPQSLQNKLFPTESPPMTTEIMEDRGIHSIRHLEYLHAMFQASLNALMCQWLKGGCQETPEELCDILLNEFQR